MGMDEVVGMAMVVSKILGQYNQFLTPTLHQPNEYIMPIYNRLIDLQSAIIDQQQMT